MTSVSAMHWYGSSIDWAFPYLRANEWMALLNRVQGLWDLHSTFFPLQTLIVKVLIRYTHRFQSSHSSVPFRIPQSLPRLGWHRRVEVLGGTAVEDSDLAVTSRFKPMPSCSKQCETWESKCQLGLESWMTKKLLSRCNLFFAPTHWWCSFSSTGYTVWLQGG